MAREGFIPPFERARERASENSQRTNRRGRMLGALTEARSMAAVPLTLLAGPIVRRVEPRLAAVWVALNQPQAVRLVLYDGRQQTPVSTPPLAAGAANTLRVGNSLHLAVAVVEIK